MDSMLAPSIGKPPPVHLLVGATGCVSLLLEDKRKHYNNKFLCRNLLPTSQKIQFARPSKSSLYRRFAAAKARISDQRFIERFDVASMKRQSAASFSN
ncbi:hypothetical protein C4D60_Mb04t27280 [Musa balbisiana]|uniref:Uncharacterized protein n=1 Tax=Musa balbisiana TaxID=52838 RepID=A0A4S8KFK5_MUSBA|nr:hypothetical protein C4D60_Mb04t27280 [Musa balbisiana]